MFTIHPSLENVVLTPDNGVIECKHESAANRVKDELNARDRLIALLEEQNNTLVENFNEAQDLLNTQFQAPDIGTTTIKQLVAQVNDLKKACQSKDQLIDDLFAKNAKLTKFADGLRGLCDDKDLVINARDHRTDELEYELNEMRDQVQLDPADEDLAVDSVESDTDSEDDQRDDVSHP